MTDIIPGVNTISVIASVASNNGAAGSRDALGPSAGILGQGVP